MKRLSIPVPRPGRRGRCVGLLVAGLTMLSALLVGFASPSYASTRVLCLNASGVFVACPTAPTATPEPGRTKPAPSEGRGSGGVPRRSAQPTRELTSSGIAPVPGVFQAGLMVIGLAGIGALISAAARRRRTTSSVPRHLRARSLRHVR